MVNHGEPYPLWPGLKNLRQPYTLNPKLYVLRPSQLGVA